MAEVNPIAHHITNSRVPTRLCDGKPAESHDMPTPPLRSTNGSSRISPGRIRRLSAAEPARRAPSAAGCGFCEITRTDCPEKVAGAASSEAATDDFWTDQPGQHQGLSMGT